MDQQPTDYGEPVKPYKPNGRALWLPIVLALLVPTIYAVFLGGTMSNRLDVLGQAEAATRAEFGDLDDSYVPRREIDLKLQTIQLQMEQVAGDVEELKEQSERQTAEIIRRIERLDTPRRNQ